MTDYRALVQRWQQLLGPRLESIVVVAVILLLHLSRNPWQLSDPPLYGEEGKYFFLENFTLGPAALFKTYAGYLHIFPRLIAAALGPLPLEKLPVPYHLSGLLGHGLLLYAIARFSRDLTPTTRTLLLFSSILLPNGGEVFLNLPNTIFFVGAAPVLLYFAPEPQGRASKVADVVCALLACLSGPFVMVYMPVFLLDAVVRRRFRNPMLWVAALATVTQLACLNFAERSPTTEQLDLLALVRALSNFFVPLFFWWVPDRMVPELPALPIILLGAYALFRYARKEQLRLEWTPAMIVLCGLMVWAASVLRGLGTPSFSHPVAGAQRYFWVPYVLFSIGLLYWTRDRRLQYGLAAAMFLSGVASWNAHIPVNMVAKPYFRHADNGITHVSVYPSPAWDFEYDPAQGHSR